MPAKKVGWRLFYLKMHPTEKGSQGIEGWRNGLLDVVEIECGPGDIETSLFWMYLFFGELLKAVEVLWRLETELKENSSFAIEIFTIKSFSTVTI